MADLHLDVRRRKRSPPLHGGGDRSSKGRTMCLMKSHYDLHLPFDLPFERLSIERILVEVPYSRLARTRYISAENTYISHSSTAVRPSTRSCTRVSSTTMLMVRVNVVLKLSRGHNSASTSGFILFHL